MTQNESALPFQFKLPSPPHRIYPFAVTTDDFSHWLVTGLDEGDAEREFESRELLGYFTRFNREIGAIRKDWSDAKLARGIRYLYGSGSSYLWEMARLPPGRDVDGFFESVPQLYADLFEVRCTRFFSHLDRGPERANPLNGPCYMLWDMDGGIDSFRYSKVVAHLERSMEVLVQLTHSKHPATLESAIHGLGHMVGEFHERCLPPLEWVASREDVPVEIRDYAKAAVQGSIQ
jgi:hypothetical protein